VTEKCLAFITPRTSIETLDIAFALRDEIGLSYIMHTFPKLKKLSAYYGFMRENLSWNIARFHYGELLLSDTTSESLNRLISFMNKIPSGEIFFYTRLSALCGALLGYLKSNANSRIALSLLYQRHFQQDSHKLVVQQQHVNVKLTSLDCNIGKNDDATTTTIGYHFKEGEDLPHLETIENIGIYLEKLSYNSDPELQISISEFTHPNVHNMFKGYFLDHIFKHCPNLKQLVITKSILVHCNPNSVSTNKSIICI
jgi:hypothetical protein